MDEANVEKVGIYYLNIWLVKKLESVKTQDFIELKRFGSNAREHCAIFKKYIVLLQHIAFKSDLNWV